MVFGHVGAGHQDDGLADEAELRDAAGTCAADDEVGSLVGSGHVADEVGDDQIGRTAFLLELFLYVLAVVLTRLPDELQARRRDVVQMLEHALVDGACTETAAHQEHRLLVGHEAKALQRLLASDGRVEQCLAHRVAGQHDLLCGEEALHAFIGHADLARFLGQQLVGDAGVAVLLLDETGDAHVGRLVERRTAGIAAHADSYLRLELLDDGLGHALALPDLKEHFYVLQQVLAVETHDRQPLDVVARLGHTLHLHATFGTDEQYLSVGTQLADGIGYRDGGKDVTAGSTAADDDS